MNKADIRPNQILTNIGAGFIGLVIEIVGNNVTLLSQQGDKRTFIADYLEPYTGNDKLVFPAPTPTHEERRIKSDLRRQKLSPEETLNEFSDFFNQLRSKHPKSAENFKVFWAEILAIIGDFPSKTWDMRWGSKGHYCPVIRIPSKKTGKWVHFMYLFPAEGLKIAIASDFLTDEFKHLFPLPNSLYGDGRAVKFEIENFDQLTRNKYLECIKSAYLIRNAKAIGDINA